MNVLLDIGLAVWDAASLVSLQNELDAVEPLVRDRWYMVVLDLDPLVRISLVHTTAVFVDVVDIVAGIKRIGEDFMDSGGCPFLPAAGSDSEVVQMPDDIENGLVLLVGVTDLVVYCRELEEEMEAMK